MDSKAAIPADPAVLAVCRDWNAKAISYTEAARRMAALGFPVIGPEDLEDVCTRIGYPVGPPQQAVLPPSSMPRPTSLPPDMPPTNQILNEPLPVQPVPISALQLVPGLAPLIVPQINPVQCPSVDYSSLVTAINGITNVLNTFQQTIRLYLEQQTSFQTNYLQSLYAIIQGTIVNRQDVISQPIGKTYTKIKKNLSQSLGNCYANCFSLGFQYPSDEAILYGLDTGRCLESCQQADQQIYQNTNRLQNETTTNTLVNESSPTCPAPIVNVNVSAPGVNVSTSAPQTTNIDNRTTSTTSTTATTTNNTTTTAQCGDQPGYMKDIAAGLQSTLADAYNLHKLHANGSASSFGDFYRQLMSCSEISIAAFDAVPLPPPPPPPPGGLPAPNVAPKLPATEGEAKPIQVPDWQDPLICDKLHKEGAPRDLDSLFQFFRNKDGSMAMPTWWYVGWGYAKEKDWTVVKRLAHSALWSIIEGGKEVAQQLMKSAAFALGCPELAIDAQAVKIVAGIVNFWTKGALDQVIKGYEYKVAESCPQEIPSQGELNAARLAAQMDAKQWECLTRANNNLPVLAKQVLFSQRTKIGFQDALMLKRLGVMDDLEYRVWAEQNGVLTVEDREALEAAATYLPGPSDLLRMMVRDVADVDAVKKFGLDDEFGIKWTGELKKYGDAQGISDETARLEWRAHWDQISNTQAFQMLHRLRPGSKLVEDAANAINFDSGGAVSMDEARARLITTEQTVRELLAINDTLPYWRDRLIAISYNPLTRTDAQRAFIIGALDEAGLKAVFMDEGYDSNSADILVKFTTLIKGEREQRKLGTRSVGKLKSLFIKGLIDDTKFETETNARIPYKPKADAFIADARLEKSLQLRSEAAACVKSSFMHGRVDAIDALEDLQKAGFVHSESLALVDRWKCAFSNKQKLATAERLCKWRGLGIIDRPEQLKRLVRLGWSAADAASIADQCEKAMSDAQQKKLQAQLRQMEADNKRLEAINLKAIAAKTKADAAAAKASAARTAEVKARAEQGGALA